MARTGFENTLPFSVEPKYLYFGNIEINQISAPQSVRLKNIDTEKLEILYFGVWGDESAFFHYPTETNVILEPNEYFDLNVSFAPRDEVLNEGFMWIETDRGWIVSYLFGTAISIVSEDDAVDVIPNVSTLLGNFPNPFNPETTIQFSIGNVENVEINVYNVRGQRVRTLLDGSKEFEAGYHDVIWNGRDDRGQSVGSGVYFYRMVAGENTAVGRMLLLK